ncbi:uncharacterized protein LOC114266138 [Camellia sinensis]|uniref:uncharacterized protein LOC114266138 n=1 Tax=Camellia sinensis TaxID=4442 RepID=UPI001036A50B|nr:uncharacterized protein LOC114266138 [Camellia sinensis]
MVNPQNLSKFICNFCDKEMNGGVYRVKQHLAGGYKNVVACKKCPSHVKDEIKDSMSQKSQSKVQLRMVPDFDEMDNDDDDDDEILEINQHGKRPVSTQGSTRREQGSNSSKSVGSKQPKQKGPMDVYFTPDPEVAVQNRKAKGKQTRIDDNDPSKKVLRDRALVWFSRWMYDTGIPFNVVNYNSFGAMVEAFGQYGPGMKPPSYHEVRVPYLQKEVDHTNKTMEDHKKDWVTYGCSLIADGWKGKRNRALINFLVNCPRGSMFIESVDASSLSKDANKMLELLDNFVERIGEANVVQVVTDSTSANVLAEKFLEAKRPHLYWTPCAAHCLDLMLEDIFKIPNFNKTFEKAIAVHGYIVNCSGLLNMMRQFTQCKDLIKPAKTRFATAFLTLSRIHQQQTNLKKMFTSEEWTTSKWAKEPQGKKTAQVILMPSFWNNVLYALKISSPLVRVLRLVDGERKPPMGYIYEAMDRAKEAIAKSFNGNEEKYKEFFEIIDNRWNVQLHRPLHAAGYYLNPEYFYANPNIEKDKEVMSGLYKCMQRLVPSNKTQDKVCAELTTYKKADGLFGMALAIRQKTSRAPGDLYFILK